ncbi:hypothetical protein [Paracoccus niistensis]|uniref:Uncharacterized protein n=1 Tax=Paracoccus niistensis TaxID=632935 RepID=A0ABV6I4N8_9RHOB
MDWKTEWFGAEEDYLLDRDLPELDRKGRLERFIRLFEAWPKLDPFRAGASEKLPATEPVVVEESASAQQDMFACAGFGDKLLQSGTAGKRR